MGERDHSSSITDQCMPSTCESSPHMHISSVYPGYISYMGCINRTRGSGQVSFLPYGERRLKNSESFTGESSNYLIESINFVKKSSTAGSGRVTGTPPLCSPEDDSEFTISEKDWKSPVQKKSSQNTSSSSGYGSTDSDQDEQSASSHSSEDVIIAVNDRKSRELIKQERELLRLRRRSVPATLTSQIPDDVANIARTEGLLRIETNVDTGEQHIMELGSTTLRRPESVMQLARRFGEIAAAQQNDIHKSRTRYIGKENGFTNSGRNQLFYSSCDRRGGFGSLNGVPDAMASRPNIFRQMDKVGSSNSTAPPRVLNPNSIKDALLRWVQSRVKDYPVNVTNFSSSWADGTAFCALIHRFAPDAFDFNKIDPRNRKENFDLAFRIAEEQGICPLLEVEDMIMMGDRPDWKCVFTYVQSFYKHFKDRE
ncbi:unnamed protein product [Auanema sp. JU1783]|nr:unnamed protein product [Auanema sp. JU1783]